jgi:hypothetical protein
LYNAEELLLKKLYFNSKQIEIQDPKSLTFEFPLDKKLYILIYDLISDGDDYKPVLNSDIFNNKTPPLDLDALHSASNLNVKPPSKKAFNKDRLWNQYIVRDFLSRYPSFLGLVLNNVSLADITISNAEFLCGETVSVSNFIRIKGVIDQINRSAWNRDQDGSESQSGVSTLGTISENLLKITFENLVDNQTFFKVDQSAVQSYGDFVLMCLPNNLWISVKSNFARERLLASGYTNDILGVGFFQEFKEFTGPVRIRNFQRAGFLAMYCPDVGVSSVQLDQNTNTYDQVMEHYKSIDQTPPTNINGMPFIRKLSSLYTDLNNLLSEKDVRRRTTVNF